MGRREGSKGINLITQGILEQDAEKRQFRQKVEAALVEKQIDQMYPDAGKALDNRKKELEIKQLEQNTGAGDFNLKPVSVKGSGSPSSPLQQRQEEFLSQLGTQDAEIVKGLADYTLDPAKTSSLRTSARQRMIALTKMYDPSFDMQQYPVRQKFQVDFTSGKARQNIQSLNTLSKHLGTMKQEMAELANTGQPARNAMINFAKLYSGDPTITNFNVAKEAILSESERLFSGVGATQEGIKRAVQFLPSWASDKQMEGFLKTMAQLMEGRGKSWESTYRTIMKHEAGDLVYDPESRAALDDILGSTSSSSPAGGDIQSQIASQLPPGSKIKGIRRIR